MALHLYSYFSGFGMGISFDRNIWKAFGDVDKINDLLPAIPEALRVNLVKVNASRSVFFIDHHGSRYYVKLVARELRKFLPIRFSKACLEYTSALQLNALNIKTAPYVGFAYSSNHTILVTRSIDSFCVNGEELWYDSSMLFSERMTLAKNLSSLIERMMSYNIVHPDFHLGNVFFSSDKLEPILIDVYGVKPSRRLGNKQQDSLLKLIVGLRYYLSRSTIISILDTFPDIEPSDVIWDKYVGQANDLSNKTWPKRRSQILDGYSKFVRKTDRNGTPLYLRNEGNSGQLDDFLKGKSHLCHINLAPDDAQKLWLLSYYLKLKCIAHIRPLVWAPGGGDLWFESNPSQQGSIENQEFMDYCQNAGISQADLIGNVSVLNEIPVISDISKLVIPNL